MKKIAFICPLDDEGTDTRKRSDDIMENIIEPVAKEFGYATQRADKMSGRNVMKDIITMLHEAEIVIADLTEMNPNVFYELGIRDAIKGKCINIICENCKARIPFDISHYRAFSYSLKSEFVHAQNFTQHIKNSIKSLEQKTWEPVMTLSTKDCVDIHGITVVDEFLRGKRDHYSAAKKLLNGPMQKIFLMQRSSSMVLNAEQGWGEEDEFLQIIKREVNRCEYFYHLITLEGIELHLRRKDSVFPNFKHFSDNLDNYGGNVVIKHSNGCNDRKFFLRKLPKDNHNPDFKLDRQSRVLITEDMENNTRAVVVQNLGTDQTCFVIQGPQAKEYLKLCINYYYECDLVKWCEIENIYNAYKDS